ncbi:hypothetical protein AB434_3495 [Heyndrickxia coagulans]|uniref:Uncharacterized protein n=1 Tax=Heyndrickxia coagulans TaxID=1398 RepID=A0A0C5C6W0_HEYCO|nr:hypothetical protein SB48_HM08orf02817 [Heyndrickxia coagulans]AKN55900.1 hypothetical protein AB434_3495 [Heyndrickxia coagulans]KWZ84078.1 hypothetical protein HMPREF3213_01137 [Heyndrickxia coagulans]
MKAHSTVIFKWKGFLSKEFSVKMEEMGTVNTLEKRKNKGGMH